MEKGKEDYKGYLCVRFYILALFGDLRDLFCFHFFSSRSLLTPLTHTCVAF